MFKTKMETKMETNLKFNCAVCTSLSQSGRLMSLGLKKETADMHMTDMSSKGVNYTDDWQIGTIPYCDVISIWNSQGLQLGKTAWSIIPVWSFLRLVELVEVLVEVSGKCVRISSTHCYEEKDNAYDNLIDAIADLIDSGIFNKEYLGE